MGCQCENRSTEAPSQRATEVALYKYRPTDHCFNLATPTIQKFNAKFADQHEKHEPGSDLVCAQ